MRILIIGANGQIGRLLIDERPRVMIRDTPPPTSTRRPLTSALRPPTSDPQPAGRPIR